MAKKRKGRQQDGSQQPVKPTEDVNLLDDSMDDVSDEAEAKRSGTEVGQTENTGKLNADAGNIPKMQDPGDSDNEAEEDADAGNGERKDPRENAPSGDVPRKSGSGSGAGSKNSKDSAAEPPSTRNQGVGRVGADTAHTAGRGMGEGLKKAGQSAGKHAKNFGEGMMAGMSGGARGIGKAFAHAISGAGGAVVHTVSNVIGKVGSALGISKMASGFLVGTLTFGAVAGGAVALLNYQYEQFMLTQEYIVKDDCVEDVEAAVEVATPAGDEGQQMQDENAAKAWAVFKAMGFTDAQAAGAIGNMYGEGHLCPFAMESDYLTCPDEYWHIGPVKESYIADITAWTTNVVAPTYGGSLGPFYYTSRHGAAAGVGLFQFTGMHYDDLEDWAAGLGTTWYDEEKAFDVQMSFAIAPCANGGYKGIGASADWLRGWSSTPINDVDEATYAFCKNYEGISNCAEQKYTAAHKYYDMFKGTMGDEAYAASILEMAQATAGSAAGSAVEEEADECGIEVKEYDNGDLARAAVAYAYKTKGEGKGNDGTELYQTLHRLIFPGDPYFQSCDRGVATAVRWAGADDSFPAGDTGYQLSYLNNNSDKWESLGPSVNMQDAGELQPGDICVCDGHIVMYVGNEIIKEKFPDVDSSSDFVSASLNTRSPGCGHDNFHVDTRPYMTFRLKQYETNSQYVDIVEGQNLNDR